MRFDGREYVYKSILSLRSGHYANVMYKWSELFKLAYQLGDGRITEGLRERIGVIERRMNASLFDLELAMFESDDFENFWLVKGVKVKEREIRKMFDEVDMWLVGELARVRKLIRFSTPPPPSF